MTKDLRTNPEVTCACISHDEPACTLTFFFGGGGVRKYIWVGLLGPITAAELMESLKAVHPEKQGAHGLRR